MTNYVLKISGRAREIVLQSLSSAQAEYWKARPEVDLHDYYFSYKPDGRRNQFRDVPEAAHIEGSWEDPDEIWHGFGASDDCDCVLLEIGTDGQEVDVWKGYLAELQDEGYGVPKTPMIAKLKSEYVLVIEADDRGAFDYCWNEISKKPTPSDFCLTYSPGDDIVIDVTLFGKKADAYDDDSKNFGLEIRVDLAARFGLENSR